MCCLASPELPVGHVKSLALHIAVGLGKSWGCSPLLPAQPPNAPLTLTLSPALDLVKPRGSFALCRQLMGS